MIAMEGRNVQLVAIRGNEIVILQPRQKMSREEAVNLAAYLVALADGEDDFIETLSDLQDRTNPRTILDPVPPDPEAA
jgi:hypothetical protein